MVSAVILTHNDQHTLAKTLDSVAFCDEVIVIDDESTDKTPQIAKQHKATVYTHALKEDFAAQRNFGLAKATGEWVLFVDSDELVSVELAQEIQQKIAALSEQTRNDNPVGFYVKRRDSMWGTEFRHGEMANVRLLRLARKTAGKWVRPVHEVWEVEGITETLEYPLLHFPHPNVAQFLEEINVYSTLNAKHFYKEGVRSNLFQIVAYPTAKFFMNYVWRLGFLDGMAGAVVAFLMSFHSFLTRSKLYILAQPK